MNRDGPAPTRKSCRGSIQSSNYTQKVQSKSPVRMLRFWPCARFCCIEIKQASQGSLGQQSSARHGCSETRYETSAITPLSNRHFRPAVIAAVFAEGSRCVGFAQLLRSKGTYELEQPPDTQTLHAPFLPQTGPLRKPFSVPAPKDTPGMQPGKRIELGCPRRCSANGVPLDCHDVGRACLAAGRPMPSPAVCFRRRPHPEPPLPRRNAPGGAAGTVRNAPSTARACRCRECGPHA